MYQCKEATPGTKAAARALRRRIKPRTGFLATMAGLLVVLCGAQPALASSITKVTPASGCPGQNVVIEGTGFKAKENQVTWEDHKFNQPGSWDNIQTNGKFVSSTKMEALVPLFIQLEGNEHKGGEPGGVAGPGLGEMSVPGSNHVPFTYNSLLECFAGGGTGPRRGG